MTRDELLIIGPDFFSYKRLILAAALKIGYNPIWLDDRASTNNLYKAALKALPSITRKLSKSTTRAKIDSIRDKKIDNILVIKGDALTSDCVRHIRTTFKNARANLYLWDSVENDPSAIEKSRLFDQVLTFDQVDSERFGWIHRPLFSSLKIEECGQNILYDWSFIGSLHSDRHKVLSKLINSSTESKFRCFLFTQNKLIKIARSIRDPTIFLNKHRTIHTSTLPYDDYIKTIHQSTVIVDIEHPKQKGLTVRTIETILQNKKLATTNKNILSSDLYDPSRVHIINRDNPNIPKSFIKAQSKPISTTTTNRYRIESWLREILESPISIT